MEEPLEVKKSILQKNIYEFIYCEAYYPGKPIQRDESNEYKIFFYI